MKKIRFIVFALIMCLAASVFVYADGNAPRLVDEADILSGVEEELLLEKLNSISESQNVDIVVHTRSYVDEDSVMDAADNIFENYRYGMNTDRSCILLLVSMEEGEWHITTAGYGITAVTDVGLEYMSEQFVPYLSEGEYLAAFTAYADICDDFINRARAGNPFDSDDLPKGKFPAIRNFLICLVIGIIAAWIIVGKEKAKLRTVHRKLAAKNYTKPGSLAVIESRDFFLYKTVNRIEKSDSSGGSTTHKTSSGTTVGGGGGKF